MKHSTLFLDESGKSSLIEKAGEPFVLTGVILDDEDVKTVEGFFNYIKRKYGFDLNFPFHSYHVFENPSTKLSDKKASEIVKTLADFLSIIPIKIKVISINKSVFKLALGVRSNNDFKGSSERKQLKEAPYKVMSANMFSWFAKYLESNDAVGQILVDARRGGDYELLRNLNMCKESNGPLSELESKTIKERCTAICFADKHFLSGGLEITDLISYTSFFNAKKSMNTMEPIMLVRLWKSLKSRMEDRSLYEPRTKDIKSFFKIKRGEVHRCLNDN